MRDAKPREKCGLCQIRIVVYPRRRFCSTPCAALGKEHAQLIFEAQAYRDRLVELDALFAKIEVRIAARIAELKRAATGPTKGGG